MPVGGNYSHPNAVNAAMAPRKPQAPPAIDRPALELAGKGLRQELPWDPDSPD